jgi:hypothetical protein
MKLRTELLSLVLFGSPLLGQGLPPSEQYHLRVEFYLWHPQINQGTIQVGSASTSGTLLDPIADLGIADAHTHEFVATVRLAPTQKLVGSYTPFNYSGSSELVQDVSFNGSTFPVGSQVVSTLTGKYWTAAYEYDFLNSAKGFLGARAGGRLIDYQTSLQSSGSSSSYSATIPLPMLGVAARFYTGKLSVSGEFSAFDIQKNGYELNGAGQFHISDRLAIEGGYRRLKLRGMKGFGFLDLQDSGWHFGGELSL